ncbi:MAG: hypothetical protein AAF993_18430, partial [Pseudomonadota bacterium]
MHVSCRRSVALLTGCCLWISVAGQVQADQLVFGSFRSAANATNWATKLQATLGETFSVVAVPDGNQVWHRVVTEDLDEQSQQRVQRRADADGIRYWRLLPSAADVAESGIIKPPPLGGARLVPPGPLQNPVEPTGSSVVEVPAEEVPAEEVAGVEQAPVQDKAHGGDNWPQQQVRWQAAAQSRAFADRGAFGQDRYEGSLSLQLDYFRGWDNDRRSITFKPFVRLDSADPQRSHGDIRELFYSRVGDNWDLHVGAKKVFWGVTEFHHLIDIVNQTDIIENVDTEDKLGQPMVQLTLVRDWGIVDLYALPGFREREFAGRDGRLRFPLPISDRALYESSAERKRVDGAVRWSHHFGPLELGLHHFSGTSREPLLVPLTLPGGAVELQPFYPVIDQTGIDAQAFYGDWAFKLEGFTRTGFGERYAAVNIGFERTLVGIWGTRADFGIVGEYLFDERDEDAVNTLFENDIALGGRLALNDFADTQALLGIIVDTQNDE